MHKPNYRLIASIIYQKTGYQNRYLVLNALSNDACQNEGSCDRIGEI